MRDQLISLHVEPGDVLAGKYRVEKVLGAGGMGVVVQAMHLELDERVALKFLRNEAVSDPEATARFMREARAAVKIKSEHVARVVDVGRLENGAPYLVMEFLHGSDLGQAVQHGPLPVADAVDCVIQACDAIAEAHAAGIVHRDLKPSNLFVTLRSDRSPLVKVLDFGISKLVVPGSVDASFTRSSALLGTPYYMSPEQLRSARNVDPRTDVWSLGAILYELLTGRPPFDAESLPGLFATIINDAPAPIRERRPEVPEALEAAVFATLEKDVKRRVQNIGELTAALMPFAPSRSRYVAERIFRISGVKSNLASLPPLPLPRAGSPVDHTLRSAEHAAPGNERRTVEAGPLAAQTNPVWSGTNRSRRRSGRMLAALSTLGLGLTLGVIALSTVPRSDHMPFGLRGVIAVTAPPDRSTDALPVVGEPLPLVVEEPPLPADTAPVAETEPAPSAAPPASASAAVSAAAKPVLVPRRAERPPPRPVETAAPVVEAPVKRSNPLTLDLK